MFYATCVEIATADLNSSFGPTKRAIKFYCCRSAYANIVSECKRVDQEGEGGGNVCRVEYLLESISKGLGWRGGGEAAIEGREGEGHSPVCKSVRKVLCWLCGWSLAKS